MGGTYKAIGINLKGAPLGEADRLLTVLTQEFGLVRAVAPGARKHNSSLGGRSSLFVINQLMIAKGRNLDKIVQAETIESFPKLGQDLRKLTAAQYLAELVLCQALSEQSQVDLFCLLREHLTRLEQLPDRATLPALVQAMFHLLALAGLAPQVQACCLTQQPVQPDWNAPNWQVAFSLEVGGLLSPLAVEQLKSTVAPSRSLAAEPPILKTPIAPQRVTRVSEASAPYAPRFSKSLIQVSASQLEVLQHLAMPDWINQLLASSDRWLSPAHLPTWLAVERLLRRYAEYHFDRSIRSATLIDACFVDPVARAATHDAIA